MTEPRTETILGKERLKYLDITKGIAILLMVWGHRVVTYSADDVRLIFSFHMPLFFIISGYFLNRETPTELFIKKKARQLLSPYYLLR